ncbi:helix-hairpin-helix domain-containing protein [Brachybacterium sp.]|uniref:helix-hairpin-helix domain-containing protein n=1 Tax=Brachybacterium sp. TaxID=1891286 RepID=UPI002ED1F024
MGQDIGSERPRSGRAGRHRRTGQALIERRDHVEPSRARRFSLPAPSPSALVGVAVLVLIAVGVVHLSGTGSAVPLETETAAAASADPAAPSAPADVPEAGEGSASEGGEMPASSAPTVDGAEQQDSSPAPQESRELIVHVSGAVTAPGVVRLPGGARVDDALSAAGGPTAEADLTAVNLARPLVDGEQVHVPVPGEDPRPQPGDAPGSGDGHADGADAGADGAASGPDAAGAIDLNTASLAELEELPGVGPAIAQRILEHREKNGPFESVDGLLEVSGIGPATLEEIRPKATV